MKLTSSAFHKGEMIPRKFSRQGGNVSPPLAWMDVPAATKSLALIMDDPDAPSGVFVHWLVYHIPDNMTELAEGLKLAPELPCGIRQGKNGFGEVGYGGPQPPSGVHRCFFHLYALDWELETPPGASRKDLDAAIRGHVLEKRVLLCADEFPHSCARATTVLRLEHVEEEEQCPGAHERCDRQEE